MKRRRFAESVLDVSGHKLLYRSKEPHIIKAEPFEKKIPEDTQLEIDRLWEDFKKENEGATDNEIIGTEMPFQPGYNPVLRLYKTSFKPFVVSRFGALSGNFKVMTMGSAGITHIEHNGKLGVLFGRRKAGNIIGGEVEVLAAGFANENDLDYENPFLATLKRKYIEETRMCIDDAEVIPLGVMLAEYWNNLSATYQVWTTSSSLEEAYGGNITERGGRLYVDDSSILHPGYSEIFVCLEDELDDLLRTESKKIGPRSSLLLLETVYAH